MPAISLLCNSQYFSFADDVVSSFIFAASRATLQSDYDRKLLTC